MFVLCHYNKQIQYNTNVQILRSELSATHITHQRERENKYARNERCVGSRENRLTKMSTHQHEKQSEM